ncbi:MAG TPA: addiction module protein [Phycisphaerae bacterium]|jgi:putative addiction module component (TIGR02574 family)|nr:addiction module protein [Phycisphaerae bacterium]
MTLAAIQSKALKLPLKQRSELAARLIASLDEADSKEIEQMWMDEAERRHRDLLAGRVKLVPSAVVKARAEKALRR